MAIFFVLSGFVIRFVTQTKERDGLSYAEARATRLYSVALVALLATLVADRIGTALAPQLYYGQTYFNAATGPGDLFADLTFTNELWFGHWVFGSDEPYWSLGFEVSYYLLFGLIHFLDGRRRAVAVAICMLVMGPKLVLYFPLWMAGVWTYDIIASGRAERIGAAGGAALFLASIAAYPLFVHLCGGGTVNVFHADSARQMVKSAGWFITVGLFAVLNLIGFAATVGAREIWPEVLVKPIRWLAGGSFTLYLVHQPLVLCGLALFPGVKGRPLVGAALIVGVFAVALLLAEIGERRKRAFRATVLFVTRSIVRQRLATGD